MTPDRDPGLDDLGALRIERSGEGPRRRRRWPWIVLGAAVVLAVAGVWLMAGRGVEVKTAAVRAADGSERVVLNASGYVTARRRATVSAKITGKVVEVLVEEGMEVKEGQLLARLDDREARSMLGLSEAQLVASRRALAETETELRLARLTLARVERLEKEGVVGRAELDAASTQVEALEARLALGREQVEVAERQVSVYRTELSNTRVVAPFAGVAISKDAQPGEMVSPISAGGGYTRTGICTIVDMASLEVEVDVNEAYIQKVRQRQRVEAVLDAYPDWKIPGSVITTIPAADRQKATVRVRIAFDRLDPRILPDMGVKVSFLADEGEARAAASRFFVPKAAVRRDGGEDVVFVLRDGRLERRAVTLAGGEGADAGILSGVVAGETVVVEESAALEDGGRASVRR